MEWTLEEFFSAGGTTSFVDRITASLGIHASEVKIVSVYEGSTVVNYEIVNDDAEVLTTMLKKKEDEPIDYGTTSTEESTLSIVSEKEVTETSSKI